MRNLLNFLIRYSTWFVFLFYVLLSCVLLMRNNTYQQSVWMTSANAVSSSVYGMTTDVSGYFGLKKTNLELQRGNADLERQVLLLKQELADCRAQLGDTLDYDLVKPKGASAENPESGRYDYVLASVINNSTSHPRNFFSIDRGADDGVRPGMGVIDHNGVVGIVNVTGRHTARVISLLNRTQHFSVKLKNTDYVGSMHWNGPDPTVAYVEEIPRHVRFHIGDTIVTSGFSTTFPEGIPVGTVMTQIRGEDDNFFTIKLRLLPDFRNLGTVRVLTDELKAELDSLQTFDNPPEKTKKKK